MGGRRRCVLEIGWMDGWVGEACRVGMEGRLLSKYRHRVQCYEDLPLASDTDCLGS